MKKTHEFHIVIFMGIPAYFLTWTTYGTWLPGDERGWVYRLNNAPGVEPCPPSVTLRESSLRAMKNDPILLTPTHRRIVERSIESQCRYRDWHLWIANCRSNHVHVILQALDVEQTKVMQILKSYATRSLRQEGFFLKEKRIWTRSGSIRYLSNPKAIYRVIDYITHQ